VNTIAATTIFDNVSVKEVGATYTGAGDLLGISEVEETSEVVARGLSLTLTGIPSAMTALALSDPFQGRKATVKLGFEGSTDTAIIFSGLMNSFEIEEGAATGAITVVVDNDLALLDRPVSRRYSDQSQRTRYPDDRAFEFVTENEKMLNWGGQSETPKGVESNSTRIDKSNG